MLSKGVSVKVKQPSHLNNFISKKLSVKRETTELK